MEEMWGKIKVLLAKLPQLEKRNRIKRYGLSIFLPIIIIFAKFIFFNLLGESATFLLASFAIAISSWYGGWGPGLLATVLTSVLTFFVFLIQDSAQHFIFSDILLVTVFIIEGITISIISEARYQMEHQKDDFIGFAAHELKNPLTSIKGFCGLIINIAKKNDYEKVLSYAQEINAQSEKITELINDLLDVTKIEIGKFTYTNTFFNLDDLVKEIVMHQEVIAKNRSIELRGRSKKTIYGDRYRIGQVIINLLSNALKYSPETKKVILKLKGTRNGALISVQDYGMGMSKIDQKKIFNRFFTARTVQSKSAEGLGIGLYISFKIVQNHKGKIWIKSKEGKGSTFFLELPTKISHS